MRFFILFFLLCIYALPCGAQQSDAARQLQQPSVLAVEDSPAQRQEQPAPAKEKPADDWAGLGLGAAYALVLGGAVVLLSKYQ